LNSAYDKLVERQKDIQHMINVKISHEIYRVQQLLVTMANHESQMDLNHYGSLQGNGKIHLEKDIACSGEKFPNIRDFDRLRDYSSLIMYNSY